MPSRSEGMPSVALESLYFRIPVIATDVGGTGEVIIDGLTGRLVARLRQWVWSWGDRATK